MIYYGDEYGMAGAGDPDNRHFMQWAGYTADQTWLHDRARGAREDARPRTRRLRRGTRTTLSVGTDTFVYKMTTTGDTVFVALNRGDTAQPATGLPAGTYDDLLGGPPVTGASRRSRRAPRSSSRHSIRRRGRPRAIRCALGKLSRAPAPQQRT